MQYCELHRGLYFLYISITLEEYIRLQGETIEHLKQHIQSQDARILEQEHTIAQLRALVDELCILKAGTEETLEEFKRQLFGTKSEKAKAAPANAADASENPPVETTVKEHTRTKKKKATREERYADIPIRDVIIPVPDKDCFCSYRDAEMVLFGHKEVRTELRITPAKVERIRYMQQEQGSDPCGRNNLSGVARKGKNRGIHLIYVDLFKRKRRPTADRAL